MKLGLKHNIVYLILLPIVTGVILSVSAFPSNYYWLSFVALIPIIFALDWASLQKKAYRKALLQLIITFVVFYLWVGGWVLKTANLGFVFALFIIIPFVLLLFPYVFFKKRKSKNALLYLTTAWLVAELIENYLELCSPFYTLGNNLAVVPQIIQWYEYTGVAGGTLWILLGNLYIYLLTKKIKTQTKKLSVVLGTLLVFFVPVLISYLIYNSYTDKGKEAEVVLIHPSTENNTVKYKKGVFELMELYTEVMKTKITRETEYVVLPETAITNAGWLSFLDKNKLFNSFLESTIDYPNLKLISGAVSYEAIHNVKRIKNYEKIPGIRYSKKYKVWYYTYNSVVKVERDKLTQIRVKDHLVPYQEYAPYPNTLPRIKPVGIDFQFSKRENNRTVFHSKEDKVGALICYEVVYEDIAQEMVQKGAEIIFVVLNEGWYNTPKVPKQFLQLSTIRAIENRRSVVHCSNMGISSFINQRGDIVAKTDSNKAKALKQIMKKNTKKTFYTNYQEYIRLFIVLLFLASFIMEIKTRKQA